MPFAGYDSFQDCVDDNQDKDDPGAFCAWLKDRSMKSMSSAEFALFLKEREYERDFYGRSAFRRPKRLPGRNRLGRFSASEFWEPVLVKDDVSLSESDRRPTEGMATEAQRALDWRAEGHAGGEDATVARARSIANRSPMSVETIRRMNNFFVRNARYPDLDGFSPGDDGYPSRARVAWALWGGDAGRSWSSRLVRRLEKDSHYGDGHEMADEDEDDDDDKVEAALHVEAGSERKVVDLLHRVGEMLNLKVADDSYVEPVHGYAHYVQKDDEKRYTLAPLYIPGEKDAHEEWASSEDLQKALWDFVKNGDLDLRLQHNEDVVAGSIVETVTWPFAVEMELAVPGEGGSVRKVDLPAGTPFLGVVWDPDVWPLVKEGKIRGYSIGGEAVRVVAEPE